jgi:hypothetical protein
VRRRTPSDAGKQERRHPAGMPSLCDLGHRGLESIRL